MRWRTPTLVTGTGWWRSWTEQWEAWLKTGCVYMLKMEVIHSYSRFIHLSIYSLFICKYISPSFKTKSEYRCGPMGSDSVKYVDCFTYNTGSNQDIVVDKVTKTINTVLSSYFWCVPPILVPSRPDFHLQSWDAHSIVVKVQVGECGTSLEENVAVSLKFLLTYGKGACNNGQTLSYVNFFSQIRSLGTNICQYVCGI